MKHTVTWHAIKRKEGSFLIAMKNDQELIRLPKATIDAMSNEELLRRVENNDWYDPTQDPEILFRGEVVRHPERHAVKVQL